MEKGNVGKIRIEINKKVRKSRSSKQCCGYVCTDHARPDVGDLDLDLDPWRLVGAES